MSDGDDVSDDGPDDVTASWCVTCGGMGGWELSGEEVDFGDTEDVECPCCGGAGEHYGGHCQGVPT